MKRGIHGFTGVYRGEHRNTGVYRSIQGFRNGMSYNRGDYMVGDYM